MKVVILAGGFGTRITEESQLKPKPMVEIGGMPILWHIMKEYSFYGFNEFIICAGYKQHIIKEWFADYFLRTSDVTFDFTQGEKVIVHNQHSEKWKVTVVDTGLKTMTGGRVRRIKKYVGNEPFMLTYGDGVSDVNIQNLLSFHKKNGTIATLTVVQPEGRFGMIDMTESRITSFREKSQSDTGFVNGGYMVLQPEVFDYLEDDNTVFEKEPLERLAEENELTAYKHDGFWQCMDTIRDKQKLDALWENGIAKWKTWKEE